jgi:hypothetical protein
MTPEILDTNAQEFQKENIEIDLQPIWEMLRHNKRKLNLRQWKSLVEEVKAGVIRQPNEYVNAEAISSHAFRQLIDKIFNEFVVITLNDEDQRVKAYKRKFDRALRHIKVLLLRKKEEMTMEEWEAFVNETKVTILNNPHDFFCFDLPIREVTTAAITQVFEGFAQDQKIRAVQSGQFFLRNFQ